MNTVRVRSSGGFTNCSEKTIEDGEQINELTSPDLRRVVLDRLDERRVAGLGLERLVRAQLLGHDAVPQHRLLIFPEEAEPDLEVGRA